MPENEFEAQAFPELVPLLEVGQDSSQAIIDAHHALLDAWEHDQNDQTWSEYAEFVDFVWEYGIQSDGAPELYDTLACSPFANDRLIAAVCLPALMQRAPTTAFELRTILVEDESEPVKRNARDAVARARAEGTLTREAEALFAAVVLLSDYRSRPRSAVLPPNRK